MEINKGGQTLIGFPALIDLQDAVSIEVFDEPDVAAAKHQAGLRRLFALHIKDALKYLEKNIPDLTKMAAAYMLVGAAPTTPAAARLKNCASKSSPKPWIAPFCWTRCRPTPQNLPNALEEGRGRLTLISSEIAASGRHHFARIRHRRPQTQRHQKRPRSHRRRRRPAGKVDAQTLHRRNPLHPTPPLRPLPQSHHRTPRQIPSRPRPRRHQTGRAAPAASKTTGAWSQSAKAQSMTA